MQTESLKRIGLLVLIVGLALPLPAAAGGEAAGGTAPAPAVSSAPATEIGKPVAGLIKGFGFSPRGFPLDYSKQAEFLAEVGRTPRGGVLWNGAWRDDVLDGRNAGQIPAAARLILEGSKTYHFTPIVVLGWRSGAKLHLRVPANRTDDWTNPEAKELFLRMLLDLASSCKPPFLFLGNESDAYYEQNPKDYANWIGFYERAYPAVKGASPATQVGPVFNFEHLAGSGALNGWTKPHWGALEAHDLAKVDIVGVTVYPWLSVASPGSVPSNYLDPLMSRVGGKPLAITETGWPAEKPGGPNLPWETSDAAQVKYLSRLSAMLEGKQVRIVNWLFLHAMQDPGGSPTAWRLFGSVSLRDRAGNSRPAWEAWLSFSPPVK